MCFVFPQGRTPLTPPPPLSPPQGNPAPVPPDGLENPGCPVGSHPGNLVDNRHCVLCADCLKACPHTSVEVRLRPPAADILRTDTHDANAPELAMLFMLLGE